MSLAAGQQYYVKVYSPERRSVCLQLEYRQGRREWRGRGGWTQTRSGRRFFQGRREGGRGPRPGRQRRRAGSAWAAERRGPLARLPGGRGGVRSFMARRRCAPGPCCLPGWGHCTTRPGQLFGRLGAAARTGRAWRGLFRGRRCRAIGLAVADTCIDQRTGRSGGEGWWRGGGWATGGYS